jgi:hypothetical protein
VPPLDPIWAGLRLIPLAILAPSNGWVGWLTESGLVCWLWAVSWGSPRLGVTNVRAVIGQFWLMDVYKLCRDRNPFEWPCPWYRTSYGVDLTRRFWIWGFEFCPWLCLIHKMVIVIPWVVIVAILITIISILYLIMACLSIALLWPSEVVLTEYVCTHVFVVVVFLQLIPTLTLKILSSWRPHPSGILKGLATFGGGS